MTSVAEPQVHSPDSVPFNLPLDAAALHQASLRFERFVPAT
jgi:hypothetical protein